MTKPTFESLLVDEHFKKLTALFNEEEGDNYICYPKIGRQYTTDYTSLARWYKKLEVSIEEQIALILQYGPNATMYEDPHMLGLKEEDRRVVIVSRS